MQTYLQRKFTKALIKNGKTEAQVQEALDDFLFADGIHCLNGDWSVGTFMDDSVGDYPALFLTYEEALAEHRESRSDFEDVHGDDDAYEGQVVAVRWLKNDVFEFFFVDESGRVGHILPDPTSAERAMGE